MQYCTSISLFSKLMKNLLNGASVLMWSNYTTSFGACQLFSKSNFISYQRKIQCDDLLHQHHQKGQLSHPVLVQYRDAVVHPFQS